jgi:hypothetical protein
MKNSTGRKPTIHAVMAIGLILASWIWSSHAEDGKSDQSPRLILEGFGKTEVAPHGEGNVYAPDVLVEGGLHRMWYGGQGRDGHDRIHLAESKDGKTWVRRGVVLDNGEANHVNDPSVVKVDGVYFMYYTLAVGSVVDEIALATSKDGVVWEKRGVVLKPGREDDWDSLLVGRPSMLHEGGSFKMWFDGRKDLPPGAPAQGVPKSPTSSRSVGLATSKDGVHWTKHHGNPVFTNDAGGVDVERSNDGYLMVYESHEGTKAATSDDGIIWKDRGLWVARSGGEIDRNGHVTPMLLSGSTDRPWKLYLGAARAVTWDRNSIAEYLIRSGQIESLVGSKKPGT